MRLYLDDDTERPNVYLDVGSAGGFAENGFVGRSARVGRKVVLAILERDPRCVMITLDPDTGGIQPGDLAPGRTRARCHGGRLRRGPRGGDGAKG